MKPLVMAITMLSSIQCFAQKWYLNSVDTTQEYGYEYWFQFQHLDDTSAYQLTKESGKQSSTIELFNNEGEAIWAALIRLKSLATDSVNHFISDLSGRASMVLQKGAYQMTVTAFGYDKFELEFEVEIGQYVGLRINLGLASELTVYQINSKIELDESEVLQIIYPVKKNREEFHRCCSPKNRYRITMQI